VIARLRGTLLERSEGAVVVDCGGVGYLVAVSGYTWLALPEAGAPVDLRVFTQAQENKIGLFGFGSAEERRLFDLLITVKNVGPSSAMSILSGGAGPEEIARMIADEEVAALKKLKGVGKKTAEMLVVELHEKCAGLLIAWGASGTSPQPRGVAAVGSARHARAPVLDEVASALVQLGWRAHEADSAVAELAVEDGATLESLLREEETPSSGREISPDPHSGERQFQAALRPRDFSEYIGQRDIVENLRVSVQAAKQKGRALDHFLFAGPPGLGKTTLAHVIANELDVKLHVTSGPAIDHKGMLASLLTSLGDRDALFIDEIHRLSPVVEENLYPAMEDFKFDLFIGDGPHAKAVAMKLPRFTLLGATTRMGLLTSPLLDRFGFHWQLGFYDLDEMTSIVNRSAGLLEVPIDDGGANEIARRARGTPRVANRLLRRVRDYAEVKGDGTVDRDIAAYALDRLSVDHAGLDSLDRAYLTIVCERFKGGPVGIDAIAASLSEERGTLEEVVEPFLLQVGLITRTPRGRCAGEEAFAHLGVSPPTRKLRTPGDQGDLF